MPEATPPPEEAPANRITCRRCGRQARSIFAEFSKDGKILTQGLCATCVKLDEKQTFLEWLREQTNKGKKYWRRRREL
jgi:hypothetical protein